MRTYRAIHLDLTGIGDGTADAGKAARPRSRTAPVQSKFTTSGILEIRKSIEVCLYY